MGFLDVVYVTIIPLAPSHFNDIVEIIKVRGLPFDLLREGYHPLAQPLLEVSVCVQPSLYRVEVAQDVVQDSFLVCECFIEALLRHNPPEVHLRHWTKQQLVVVGKLVAEVVNDSSEVVRSMVR